MNNNDKKIIEQRTQILESKANGKYRYISSFVKSELAEDKTWDFINKNCEIIGIIGDEIYYGVNR